MGYFDTVCSILFKYCWPVTIDFLILISTFSKQMNTFLLVFSYQRKHC